VLATPEVQNTVFYIGFGEMQDPPNLKNLWREGWWRGATPETFPHHIVKNAFF